MVLSEQQKMISKCLLTKAMSIEELSNKTGLKESSLMHEIEGLFKLKLIEKQGFPATYHLVSDIQGEVMRQKNLAETDSNKIRVHALIQSQAVSEKLVSKSLHELEKLLKERTDYLVYSCKYSEIQQEQEHFTGFIQLDLSIKDFSSVVSFVFYFGPASIEVIKPDVLEIKIDDLQDSLNQLSNMVHAYTEKVINAMSKQELELFNKKLSKDLANSGD